MNENEIFVPILEWLIGGSRIGGTYNRYFGSCGTDAQKGFIGKDIFNYTVYIEKIDETKYLRAAWHSGTKSFSACPEDEIRTQTFECEKDSLPLVRAWLEEELRRFRSQQ